MDSKLNQSLEGARMLTMAGLMADGSQTKDELRENLRILNDLIEQEQMLAFSFSHVDLMPNGEQYHEAGHSAVNAIAIADKLSWREAYESLLKQAHRLCCLPDEEKCVRAMLEDHGFICQPSTVQAYSGREVFAEINEKCSSGAVFIIRSNKCGGKIMTTLIDPSPDGSGYRAIGEGYPRKQVKELWIRWPDGQDHSPVARRKRKITVKKEAPCANIHRNDHKSYRYYLATPDKINQGDCVVRAISAACGISWHEAIDALAASVDYRFTVLNKREVYAKLLESMGFEHHEPMKLNGKKLTGKEFCGVLQKTYFAKEPVFAKCGTSHVVAIRCDDGLRYKILDSWDSSDKKMGEYWIKK